MNGKTGACQPLIQFTSVTETGNHIYDPAGALAFRTAQNRPMNEDALRGMRRDGAELLGSGKLVIGS